MKADEDGWRGGSGSAHPCDSWMDEHLNLQRSSDTPKTRTSVASPMSSSFTVVFRRFPMQNFPFPSSYREISEWPIPSSDSEALQIPCSFVQILHCRGGASPMAAMSCHHALRVPYLRVYKDGQLVDGVCLQGRHRWIAGRHADCDICVGHASTSRRHLEIQVLQDTQELLLVDLNSAHGTRVNGEALASASPFTAKQDDTVQMGASTRSYKVDWVPVTVMHHPARATAASALEPSSPRGSSASFLHNLGNIQGARKPVIKESSSKGMGKGASSPTRAQGQRGGRPELPPRTPARRVPFANVQASAFNVRSPQGHSLRKATTLPEKLAHPKVPKVVAVMEDRRPISATAEAQKDGASPSFWLRKCSSAPLVTAGDDVSARDENEAVIVSVVSRECSGEDSRSELPLKSTSTYDEYPSDKENWQPRNTRRKSLSCDGRQSCSSPNIGDDRQPFAVLQADPKWLKPVFSPSLGSSPDSDVGSRSRTLGLPPARRPATSALVDNLDSLFGKLKLRSEPRCEWHVVVDTNCLLDTEALQSLKQLEGIRETRIIIPKIVLRELDGLKRRYDVGHSSRVALKWIEDCMDRIPFWMHVQKSTETLPLQRLPPSSSRIRSFSGHRNKGIMSPTNDDHILDCALLFDRSETDGRVVLLTRDTALRIKARAEGMTVEDATSFCQSLLSPYSERFLWLGSTAYRPPVKGRSSTQPFTGYDESYATAATSPFSTSSLEMRSARKLSPEAKGHGKHGVAEFRCHYKERPQGLQVVLA